MAQAIDIRNKKQFKYEAKSDRKKNDRNENNNN